MKSRVWCVSCFQRVSPKNTTRNNAEVITQVITRTAGGEVDLRELDREREPEKKFTTPVGAIWGGTPMLPRPRRDGEKILPLTHTPKIEGWSPSKINCLDPLPRFLKGGRPEKKLYATPLALVREGGRPSESHQTNESGPLRRSLPRSA